MRLSFRKQRSFAANESGAAAVELAFLLPMLAVLLAGIVDLGRAVWLHQSATKATRDAVRFLSRAPDPWNNAAYQTQASNLARTGSLDGSAAQLAYNITASFNFPVGAAAGLSGSNRMVTGLVRFDYQPLTGFGFVPAVSLQAVHIERYIGE